jgi:hypothetical protein
MNADSTDIWWKNSAMTNIMLAAICFHEKIIILHA